MKVLFLVQANQRAIHDRLYEGVMANCDCDIRWLSSEEQADLRRYFKEKVDSSLYDRVLFFLRSKKEFRQVAFIRSVPNLVILEHDACQNYMPGKYSGRFTRHYKRIPWVRVLSSGYGVAEKLRAEGVDAVFVPKYYDQTQVGCLGGERDIELAFIGSLKSNAYIRRRQFLEDLAKVENLLVTRTASGGEYCRMLNRIRFFVSADIGLGEYMAKNFEAMACGCVLFAYDQGEGENRAIGFVNMNNVVLYRGVEDFRSKLSALRSDPELADRIAENGRFLVEREYTHLQVGRKIVDAMREPLRPRPVEGFLTRLRFILGV